MRRLQTALLALSALLLLAAKPAAPLQPDRRGAASPERNFDLQKLELDLDVDPAGTVQGTARLTVQRLWPGPLELNQVALEIADVSLDGGPVPWRLDGDRLLVELPGEGGTVSVRYRGTPRLGLHFRRAEKGGPDRYDEVWSQGEAEDNRYWYPSWDHPSDRFLYEGKIRAPSGLTVITNSGQELVNYLVMVAAGPYAEYRHPAHPDLIAYVPPDTPQAAVNRVMDPLPGMMSHFAARTGLAYPFGPYRQVFVQRFIYGAMENTSATILGERFLVDDRVGDTRPYVESIVAHELAHQWFGDHLTCRNWRELWLNEGFATFMAADWMGTAHGDDVYAHSILGNMAGAKGGPAMARRFHQGSDGPDSGRVYVRGASTLHMLRVMLGEERFWAGVQRYVARNGPGLVETDDLRRAFEAVSGRDLQWFFQQWVELSHHPSLRVRRSYGEGRLTVSVHQDKPGDQPLYSVPLEIEVGLKDGSTRMLQGWLDDEDTEMVLDLAEPPTYVAFDPRRGILADVDQEQSPEAWAAQLANSPSAFAQRDAVAALGETDRSEALAAVATRTGAPLMLRVAAIEALGQQRVTDPVVALLDDAHGPVRAAAAQALGRSLHPEAVATLTRHLRKDPNPDVKTALLNALARQRPAAALVEARRLLGLTDTEEQDLRAAAQAVVGAHGLPSDLDLLLDPKAPARLGRSALQAAVALVVRQEPGKARDRMAERCARYAETLLADRDLRTREAAIPLLGQVGDRHSIDRLERYRRLETEPGQQAAARLAVDAIRKRLRDGPETESPNAMEARLEALEERLKEVETTTRKLEDRM